jgi:hypothetical protein
LLPTYTALDRASEYLSAVKAVRVSGWPLCTRCVRTRVAWLVLTGLLFWGGLAAMVTAFVIGVVLDGDQTILLAPILDGFAAMLLAPLPFARSSLTRLTHTVVTPDGSAVRVSQPHPEFSGRLPVR